MTHPDPATCDPTPIIDQTPAGLYEIADAEKLIKAADHIIEFLIGLDHPAREPLFGIISAIRDKLEAAGKAIEAR